jgi:hypothetical protein
MKNVLFIDLDSDRTNPGHIIIGKPDGTRRPSSQEEHTQMVIDDMMTLCEALCTLIHLAEDQRVKPSADSLRDCIKHLKSGCGDASFETIDNSVAHEKEGFPET